MTYFEIRNPTILLILYSTLFSSSLKLTSFRIITHHLYNHLIISTFINMSNNLHQIQILQEHCPIRIGDYVIVNNRDYGYVIAIKNNNVDIKVKYAITDVIQDISVYDCNITSIGNNTNLRSGSERHVRTAPPILPNNKIRKLKTKSSNLIY